MEPEFVIDFPTLLVAADWAQAHCVVPDGFERGKPLELVDWQDAGLPGHSGAVRYRRRIDAPAGGGRVTLDLGDVRGTAEVLVDGAPAGVRVCAPYRFELDGRIGADGAELEIVVCNTLAPHLDAVGPTPYVWPGQKRSGLFGPVTLRVA